MSSNQLSEENSNIAKENATNNVILELNEKLSVFKLKLSEMKSRNEELKEQLKNVQYQKEKLHSVNGVLIDKIESIQRYNHATSNNNYTALKNNTLIEDNQKMENEIQELKIKNAQLEEIIEHLSSEKGHAIEMNRHKRENFSSIIWCIKDTQEANTAINKLMNNGKLDINNDIQYIDYSILQCFNVNWAMEHLEQIFENCIKVIFQNLDKWNIKDKTLLITDDIIIESIHGTILNINGSGHICILNNVTLKLDNIQMTNCYYNWNVIKLNSGSHLIVNNCKFHQNKGGNALIDVGRDAILDLTSCKFDANKTENRPSCLLSGTNSQLTIKDCQFINHEGFEEPYNDSDCVIIVEGRLEITDSHFENNMCNSSKRCLIGTRNDAEVTINKCLFKKCSRLIFSNTTKSLVFKCKFIENGHETASGGIILLNGHGEIKMIKCDFLNNMAANGGSIFISRNSKLKLISCYFEGNKTLNKKMGSGGAIFAYENTITEIVDSVFKSNLAATVGGGISLQKSAIISISNCIFDNNSATGKKGYAIYSDMNSTIKRDGYIKYLGLHSNDKENVFIEKKFN